MEEVDESTSHIPGLRRRPGAHRRLGRRPGPEVPDRRRARSSTGRASRTSRPRMATSRARRSPSSARGAARTRRSSAACSPISPTRPASTSSTPPRRTTSSRSSSTPQAGSPADITVLPQPGLIADLASKGFLTPLGDETQQWLARQLRRRPVAGSTSAPTRTRTAPPHLYALPLQDRREDRWSGTCRRTSRTPATKCRRRWRSSRR